MQGIPRVRYGQTMPKSLVCLFGIPSLTRTKRKCDFFWSIPHPLARHETASTPAYLITKNPLSNLVRIKHALVGRRGSRAAHAQNDAGHSILFSRVWDAEPGRHAVSVVFWDIAPVKGPVRIVPAPKIPWKGLQWLHQNTAPQIEIRRFRNCLNLKYSRYSRRPRVESWAVKTFH